jgi:hypothetical protein
MGIQSMASVPSLKSILAALALLGTVTAQTLNPVQDILLPSSESASSPLEWLGANGPWFAGMLGLETLLYVQLLTEYRRSQCPRNLQ